MAIFWRVDAATALGLPQITTDGHFGDAEMGGNIL